MIKTKYYFQESTSSTASNNTDFEIEPSSKLRVIWDDSVQSSISSNRQNFTKQPNFFEVEVKETTKKP